MAHAVPEVLVKSTGKYVLPAAASAWLLSTATVSAAVAHRAAPAWWPAAAEPALLADWPSVPVAPVAPDAPDAPVVLVVVVVPAWQPVAVAMTPTAVTAAASVADTRECMPIVPSSLPRSIIGDSLAGARRLGRWGGSGKIEGMGDIPEFTTRPELAGTFGMVASTHWLASAAGMAVLERGGNAFDAVVATGLVLQVVEPHLNGPGGEVPVIAFDAARGETFVVCGQGTAPAAATVSAYSGLDLVPGSGLLAACVPGAFGAWMLLLREYGTLRLRDVLG